MSEFKMLVDAVNRIEKKVDMMPGKMKKDFVSKDEFQPVKLAYYGALGTAGISIIGAVLALVIL